MKPAGADRRTAAGLARRITLTLAIPLWALGLLEALLTAVRFGHDPRFLLPFRIERRDCFVDNAFFTHRFFPPYLTRLSAPLVLAAEKPADAMRIVVLGESAALGEPADAFGFPRQLEVFLSRLFPDRRIEVINAAMTAINSHVISEIAREMARHQPDYFVLYLGNNEVVGPFGPGTVLTTPHRSRAVIRLTMALSRTRLGQALQAFTRRWFARGMATTEWAGLEMFLKNRVAEHDPRLATTVSLFRDNLEQIVNTASACGAGVILCTVAVNLRDCPPFASASPSPSVEAEWLPLFEEAVRRQEAGDLPQARSLFQQALGLHEPHAETWYRLGHVELALGDREAAQRSFIRARDLDLLRFRADTRLNETIRSVARQVNSDGLILVDVEKELAARSPDGVPGNQLFVDHVHFGFAGNHQVAAGIAEALRPDLESRWGAATRHPPDVWESARVLAYTPLEEAQLTEFLLDRYRRPPFIGQPLNSAPVRDLTRNLESLREHIGQRAPEEWIREYREAVAQRPNDPVVRMLYAQCLFRFNRLPEAAAEVQRVVEALPHRPDVRWELAMITALQGKTEKALALLGDPRHEGFFYPAGCVYIGDRLAGRERWTEAVSFYRCAVARAPRLEAWRRRLAKAEQAAAHSTGPD